MILCRRAVLWPAVFRSSPPWSRGEPPDTGSPMSWRFCRRIARNWTRTSKMTRVREWGLQDRPLNTVNFESPSHTGTLLSGLNTLRAKGFLLDVTLVADGEAFQVSASDSLLLAYLTDLPGQVQLQWPTFCHCQVGGFFLWTLFCFGNPASVFCFVCHCSSEASQ